MKITTLSEQAEHNIKPENGRFAEFTIWHKLARSAVVRLLSQIQHGQILLTDGQQQYVFGQITASCDLQVNVTIINPSVYLDVISKGSIGAGESYMRQTWVCDNLTALTRIFVINRQILLRMNSTLSKLSAVGFKVLHFLNRNNKSGSKRNIQAHYDIGNAFFQLFLDPTMMYSAAIYPYADADLATASRYKIDLICRKLDLRVDQHLLEIGTGWGELAIHAAQKYGVRVTTTTISEQQYEFAKQRVSDAGLNDKVTVILSDYRDLQGEYDRLVSVEMIEAVGPQYYPEFFQTCNRLLKPNGLMLLQAITIAEPYYASSQRSVDFIQRYIFPGGSLPANHIILAQIAQNTDMRLLHMDDFGEHYARTLQQWRQRFLHNIPQVKAQGYSEAFIRMWEYYLCYCEGGFLERSIGVAHLLFGKPLSRRPALIDDQQALL